ncbi:extracellular solute-binding protein [Polymorphospora rubra]|uniref:Sugar ABC transporter substrate-binding protein n=2 Tax=Polymorphospora rubra TaxID=338584 RepID=A0A810MUM0_9ACTN|nr:extracellular solute-binding protein [Polymorphospora rubra]BCJ64274.1 sugar ABC transporter substrate-binding protein [Polymorphospora rubra]
MRSRFLTAVALAATAALALTGCGSGGSGDGGSDVTLWMYPVIPDQDASQKFWADFEADFEAENPDTNLTIELLPWDNREEKIGTAIAAGKGPDLVLLTPDLTANFHSTRGLKPIGAAVDDRSKYFEGALAGGTIDGEIYGLPIYQTSTTAVYNKAAFAAAGITDLPKTWDDVLAAAPALAAKGIAVMDYSGSPEVTLNQSFYPLLWQAGGTVFTPDGKDVAFDGPAGVAALQFLLDLQAASGLPADAATKPNKVEGGPLGLGKVAMGYAVSKPEAQQMQAGVGAAEVVVGQPLTGARQRSFGTPGLITLTTINSDDNEEAALAVARRLASPEVQHELNVASGTYPSRTDVQAPGTDEITTAYLEALKFANPGEAHPGARQVMAALAPHLQGALQGKRTAAEALTDAATEARGILSRLR